MKAFVTGGGGFLGLALVKFLRGEGHDVVSLQRGLYPELEATGARCLRGDIGDLEGVTEAAAGCDTVFHVAAKAGVWGKYEDSRGGPSMPAFLATRPMTCASCSLSVSQGLAENCWKPR